MKKYLLEVIVFITGAGVMVFELVGAKVLAGYAGSSIIVWSSLIGVILTALSAGYWWGGRRADRKPDYRSFAAVIFMAAVFVFLTGVLKLPILNIIQKMKDIRLIAVLGSLILFGPGSFFMAAVSPYAVRLRIGNLKESGETVGNLYAVSTVGSIFGAFLTGFVLVLYLGNTKIIFLLSFFLLIASILAFREKGLAAKVGTAVVVLLCLFGSSWLDSLSLDKNSIYINSQYSDLIISKGVDEGGYQATGRPTLRLATDPTHIQSAMFADDDNDSVLPYSKFFRALAKHFQPNAKDSLLIGGAAYSVAKDFMRSYPDGKIDVVEIDPKMIDVAKKYFNIKDDPRLTSYTEDGRVFLNHPPTGGQKKYDVIFMDAYKTFVPPQQLTTLEAVTKMKDALNDDGIVIVNSLSSIEGDTSKFFRSEYATYKKVFPQVYVFRAQVPFASEVQNLIIVASKSDKPLVLTSDDKDLQENYLSHIWDGEIKMDLPILTDDYAPVEQLMLAVAKQDKIK